MKRLFLTVIVMLCVATAAPGQSPPPRGGLIDSVTQNYGDRTESPDRSERPGGGLPPNAANQASKDAELQAAARDQEAIKSLDAHIASLDKFVTDRQSEIAAASGPNSPVESIDTLKSRLASLRTRREKMLEEHVNANRNAARNFAEKVRQFEAGFSPHVEALRKGEKPASVSAAEWATTVDRFQTGQGRLARELQDLELRLHHRRQAALEGVGSAIDELQRQLDALPNAGPDVRRLLTRREAEIALDLAQRRLAELRQIRQEYEGQPSDRRNERMDAPPVPDLPPRGGGLAAMIEGLADQLKAGGVVPEFGGPLGEPAGIAPRGTPGAENLDRGDLLRGQMTQLGNDLRHYRDQLATVQAQVLSEERDDLEVRRDIETAKRPVLPPNPSKQQEDEWRRQSAEHQRQVEAELAAMQKEHEKVRGDLIERRTKFLTDQINRVRVRLEETGAALDALPKSPPP